MVLTPGAELSATGVSLTALTERVHSDGAILPGRKCFLLMMKLYYLPAKYADNVSLDIACNRFLCFLVKGLTGIFPDLVRDNTLGFFV